VLPEIPVIDLGAGGVVDLAKRERDRVEALIDSGRRQYTALVLYLTDHRSRRWLARSGNPYLAEIEAIAAALGHSGLFALNLSFEWACTAGVCDDPLGPGTRLMRTLDWLQHGLGRYVVVARHRGSQGAWLNITWPGFVGVVTGLAPGRFAAAILQPPLHRTTGLLPLDWLINRLVLWENRALPPSHLLRQVFETCSSFAEARKRLMAVPICSPAIFVLSGVGPGEAAVIERLESHGVTHDGAAAAANHWLTKSFGYGSRGIDSEGRQHLMSTYLAEPPDGLSWLVPPIINRYTRLAMVANAATGELVVQGWEVDGPGTAVLRLSCGPTITEEANP
jgi:hypothetical protein